MQRDASFISLNEFIECAVKIGLPASRALDLAREQGYRFDNNMFYRDYREVREAWRASR